MLLLGAVHPTLIVKADQADVTIIDETIKLDPSYQHEPFEGWGTALVWFGNVTGGWPDDIRNELADALFGEEGLNLNIARYNIGGGDSPETEPYMRLGGAVPGYWNRPVEFGPTEEEKDNWEENTDWWDPDNSEHWNWEKDKNQQWWLEAAKARGADKFEAFSNSPPYFMTQSGYTSGNVNPWDDNIRPDQYENFAIYLTKVVEYLQNELDIDIQTLSPINEPNNGYWGAGGRQEGSNWSHESQAKIIKEVNEQLESLNLDTIVSGVDETNPQRLRESWESFNEATQDHIKQLNVHTYGTDGRSAVRDISKGEDKRLWMSEVDVGPDGIPQNFENIEPGLALSERITSDIMNLEPKAWVLWQAIEDEVNMNADAENMNWGLIQVDLDPEDFSQLEINKNKKYYTMANYTKFIRPGYQMINTDNQNTLAAIDKDKSEVVVVYTNHSDTEQAIDFDLSGFESIGSAAKARPYVTSAEDNLSKQDEVMVTNAKLSTKVPPQSVSTFVISDISGVSENAGFFKTGLTYHMINKNSGLILDVDGESIVQNKHEFDKSNQEWLFEKITDGHTNAEKYKIMNAESEEVLTRSDDKVLLATDENLSSQRWIISTSGTGEYTFINEEGKDLLEVGGQSEDEGASVGVWKPHSGANQAWEMIESGITYIDSEVIWTTTGEKPVLPNEVTAEYSNGETVVKAVDWDEIDSEQYESENQFVVQVTVDGTDVKAEATIYVSDIASIEDSKLKTVTGVHPTLPEDIDVDLNIGAKISVPVIWQEIDPSEYEELGVFTVKGSIENSDVEVLAYVQVVERGNDNIALNTGGSEFPKASASFSGKWDPVERLNDGDYEERWTNWEQDHWRENDWVQIEFAEEETISEVKFTFYDDSGGTRPPESLYLEYWDGNEWIEIPDTQLKVEDIKEVITFPQIDTSKIRAQMTAMPDACIAILEMEVMGLADVPVVGDDASLKTIMIDGENLSEFSPEQFHYEVILESDVTELPLIEVATNDLFANYEMELPTSVPGEVIIFVESEDGSSTEIYTIDFVLDDEGENKIDKTDLISIIEEGNGLDPTKYTEESWSILIKALEKAKEMLENDHATQKEIDHAFENLEATIKALQVKEDPSKGENDQDEDEGEIEEEDGAGQDNDSDENDQNGEDNQNDQVDQDEQDDPTNTENDQDKENDERLPETATSIFNILLIGLGMLAIGAMLVIRRRIS